MRPDDISEWTAEDWASLREERANFPMREWSAAEERAYARGLLCQMERYFKRLYTERYFERVYTADVIGLVVDG